MSINAELQYSRQPSTTTLIGTHRTSPSQLALHVIRRYLQLSDCMLGLSAGMPGWRHSTMNTYNDRWS